MAAINEEKLKNDIKSGSFSNVYLLGGPDFFFAESYAKTLVNKLCPKENRDMNLHEFDGKYVSVSELSDACEALPFFADVSVCTVTNLNPANKGECPKDKLEGIIEIIKNIPETTVLIFYYTLIDICGGKKTVRTEFKKLTDAVSKAGTYCLFPVRTASDTAKIICSLAKKKKCGISMKDALLLADKCAFDMLMINNELDKLAAYSKGNDITGRMIDELCAGENDAKIYELTDAVLRSNRTKTLNVLGELIEMRTEPMQLLYSITGSFVDYYRASAALRAGKSADDASADFNCRSKKFALEKAFSGAGNISDERLLYCIDMLIDCEIKIKRSGTSVHNAILEETLLKMLS